MAIDLNSKPWYVAAIVGVVLGIAMFVVMNIYVFKDIRSHIERLETNIDELEREIEKGRAAKADLPRLEAELRSFPMGWGPEADRRIPLVLAGWVLTALALSMGAPFWFDALNKLNIVRSAGRRPERAPPAQA